MNYEKYSPPMSKRRLRDRSPLMNLEILTWNDDTTTVNVTFQGMSQRSFGPFPGPISFAEALIAVGTVMRMEQ